MNTKRTILIFTGIALLICFAVIGALYYKLYRTSDLPYCIPAGAQQIYFANTGNILQLVLSGKLKQDFSTKDYQRNPYLKNIPDIKNIGIDFLNGAAFVVANGVSYGLIPLKDADRFAKNTALVNPKLLTRATAHKGFRKVFSLRDSFTLAWNEELLLVLPKRNADINDERIYEILHVKKDASFANSTTFKQVRKDDALIWFFHQQADLRISQPSALKGFMMYDSVFTILASGNIEKPYSIYKSYRPISTSHNFIYADTANRFTNELMLELARIFLPGEISKIRALSFHQFNKIFVLEGRQVLENRVVSYVYDDEFNKHPIETIQNDTVNKAFMTFGRPGSLWHSTFSSIPGEYDTTSNHLPTNRVKLMAHFNQDLTETVFPLGFKYNIQFICLREGGYETYHLRFKVDDLKVAFNGHVASAVLQ